MILHSFVIDKESSFASVKFDIKADLHYELIITANYFLIHESQCRLPENH